MRTLWNQLGAWVDRQARSVRVYADANVPSGLVGFMRRDLGWDVFFVLEDADLRRAADTEHYRLARQMNRTLITLDRDFFDDRRFPPSESGGVIVLSAPDEIGLARLLRRAGSLLNGKDTGNHLPLAGRKLDLHPEIEPSRTVSRTRRRR